MQSLVSIIEQVYEKDKRNLFTFLTGAGISADSGIPTYRGSDGIWIKGTKYHRPEYVATFQFFLANPEDFWQFVLVRKKLISEAKPNESHFLLVEIEKLLGERFQLITQNIDNLHPRAGNQKLYEIHGNYREVKCSNTCREILPMPSILKGKGLEEDLTNEETEALKCPSCGHWLRPNVLLFDEFYDERTNKKDSALKAAKNSGVLFVIGTSGATNLPMALAQQTLPYGGYVVDINIEDNLFTELIQNKKNKLIVRQKSSEVLPLIKNTLENLKPTQ